MEQETNPLRKIGETSVNHEGPEEYSDGDSWWEHIACRNQGHKMFPQVKKDLSYITEARRICRSCPVRAECLNYALEYPVTDLHGVWGGLTPRQLSAEARNRGISPVKPTLAQLWASYD